LAENLEGKRLCVSVHLTKSAAFLTHTSPCFYWRFSGNDKAFGRKIARLLVKTEALSDGVPGNYFGPYHNSC
jgi:hypothetical protein